MKNACLALLALSLALGACECGDTDLVGIHDEPEPPDAGITDPTPGPRECQYGAVSGRVCAPDDQTWVNGAVVAVNGLDCNGNKFSIETTSGDDGSFVLADVPAGARILNASLGAFSQELSTTVTASQVSVLPDNALCVAQKTTRIAVVTGPGDHIEDLLSGLGLEFDLFNGSGAAWTSSALPFLSDLNRLKSYDLVFIDCAAAKTGSNNIDLGRDAAKIAGNLSDYVRSGGSLYASDWAMLFPTIAFPGKVDFLLNSVQSVSSPFNAKQLMGFAPQTVNAEVLDKNLAAFLGKQSVTIAFPNEAGAQSNNWGLIERTDASVDVLIRAPSIKPCTTVDLKCAKAGNARSRVPLAVRFKMTPEGQRGGNVVYTSFHNIAQPTSDVSRILQYLVLNL